MLLRAGMGAKHQIMAGFLGFQAGNGFRPLALLMTRKRHDFHNPPLQLVRFVPNLKVSF